MGGGVLTAFTVTWTEAEFVGSWTDVAVTLPEAATAALTVIKALASLIESWVDAAVTAPCPAITLGNRVTTQKAYVDRLADRAPARQTSM